MSEGVRSQRGASFIEVVAAVALFALVAIGLSPALLSARKVADLSKDQAAATALAQDVIENIRQTASTSVATGSDGPLKPDGTSGGIFSRSWNVATDSPTTGVNRVTVTVSWWERQNQNSVTLVTLVPQ